MNVMFLRFLMWLLEKFLIAYVAPITLGLDSAGLEGGRCRKGPEDSGQQGGSQAQAERRGVRILSRPRLVTSEASNGTGKAVGFTQATSCKSNLSTCKAVRLCLRWPGCLN